MKKNDTVYVRHMIDAIRDIVRYMRAVASPEKFFEDDMRFNAVVRQLEVIGEAAAHLSEEFQEKHPEVPWRKIIGMRNRLIHEYFGVDENIVWGVSTEELPPLLPLLETYFSELHE